ncbi:metallophosphatase domain-containing protein [Candidatus Obscuribacterales bacterium]|nr:metallophosphatase domain-containing protein [Candidatus Obscuribacterales bacterium]
MMRLVLLSDTHALPLSKWAIPDGDVLIHAGDFCQGRTVPLDAVRVFNDEMAALPHEHKLLVGGNHDWPLQLEAEEARALLTAVTYIEDGFVTIGGIKFYGSPWQPDYRFWAFNLQRRCPELKAKWAAIPDDTDVLITHTPPFGILDFSSSGQESVGCELLRRRLENISPKLHVFGHVHEGRGQELNNTTLCVNAASVDSAYEPVHKPVVVDLDTTTGQATIVQI